MATKMISTNFNDFFSSRKVIFAPYRESGLLVLENRNIVFLSVDPPTDVDDVPTYTKISTLKIARRIPGYSEICEIIPSDNGKYVALCGVRFVLTVEMPKDFWSNQSILSPGTFSHFRASYIVDFFVVNPNLVLKDNGPPIRKCEWMSSSSLRVPFSLLGVLYEDNRLRIYKITESKSQPVVGIDFRGVLNINHDAPLNQGFGLANKMISFTFGPGVEKTENTDERISVLALDSDGEIYYAECHLKYDLDAEAIGPLNISGINSSDSYFYRNTEDLVYIKHGQRCNLPTFAFCSDDGNLFHAVLNRRSSYNVELILLESLHIEDWDPSNVTVVLRRDPNELGQYLIITEKQVIAVDVSATVTSIVESNGSTADLEPCTVRALFNSVTTDKVHLTSVALVLLANDNDYVTLLAVMDSEDNFWANVIYRTVKKHTFKLEAIRNVQPPPSRIKSILTEKISKSMGIPQMSINAVNKEDRAKAINHAVDKLVGQITYQKEVSESVLAYVAEVEKRATSFVENRDDAHHRLAVIFDNIQENKMKLGQQKDEYKILDDRFTRIIDTVEKRAYNVKDDNEARISLDAIQKQCFDFSSELRLASNNMLKAQTKLKAPVKPFQASVSAQTFMLSKNTVEIANLENQLRAIQAKAAKLEGEH